MTPRASIVIPTYNGAAFIRRTLESVFAQTEPALDVVVVDDASTDDTVRIVESFAADPRLRLIRHARNLGVGDTWNEAVRAARCEAVKLLCQDDLIRPTCVADQLAALESGGGDGPERVVLVGSNRDIITRADRPLMRNRGMTRRDRTFSGADAARRIFRSGTNPIGEPSAAMFRRSAFDRTPGWDGSNLYAIDVAMWLALLRQGSLRHVGRALCAFRVSPSALSTRLARDQRTLMKGFWARVADDWADVLTPVDRIVGRMASRANLLARSVVYRVPHLRRATAG